MKKSYSLCLAYLCFFYLLTIITTPVQAAGILGACVNGASSCSPSKMIFPTYKSNTPNIAVKYRVDRGPFGDFSNSDISQAIEDVLAQWNNVPTSRLEFIKDGDGKSILNIREDNFSAFLNPAQPLGHNIIILDENGKIVDKVFGKGAKTSVLGFAGASFIDFKEEEITESNALFNGLLFSAKGRNSIGLNASKEKMLQDFKSTTLHEFGHMIGLDHSQIFLEEFQKLKKGSLADLNDIPVMFPVLVNPLGKLLWDDMVAISAPVSYRNSLFKNNFGKISGRYLKANKQAVLGGNLIAYNVDDPFKNAVSSSSDILVNGRGDFLLEGLSPGEYIIKAEPVFSKFTGASSVGPHKPPKTPNAIPTGFYMGPGNALLDESLSIGITEAQRIIVKAGQEIENLIIGILSSESSGDSDPHKSFLAKGKVLNKSIRLKNKKERAVRIALKNTSNSPIRIQMDSDRSDLVRFKNDNFILNKNKKTKIILASGNDFKATLAKDPNIELDSKNTIEIKLRIIDTTNNYEDNSQTLNLIF